jgi:hypothetical protein
MMHPCFHLPVPRIDRKRPPVPACKQACLHAGVTVLVQYRYRTGIPTVYRVYSRTAVLLAVTGGRSLGTVRGSRPSTASKLLPVVAPAQPAVNGTSAELPPGEASPFGSCAGLQKETFLTLAYSSTSYCTFPMF